MSRVSIRIVTPSFQQGAYIEQTIRSVLSQELAGLAYFVADGGSTDGTVATLQRCLRGDQWRSYRDRGQVDALVQSFQVGDEEILGWVNSDDYLLPGALEQVVAEFTRDPELAIVHGNGVLVDESGHTRVDCPSMSISLSLLAENNVLVQPSTFFRRSWYERVGGFDIRLSKAFDYDLFLRIVKAGGRCRHVPQALSAFRVHTSGQTSALWRDFVPEVLAVQWMSGDRRHFARRFAAKLCLLIRGPVSHWRKAFHTKDCDASGPAGADSEIALQGANRFLADRLDELLPAENWRADAPAAVVARYVRAELALLGIVFGNANSSRLGAAMGLATPANLAAIGTWLRHVITTQQVQPLWQVWQLARRRRTRQSCRLTAVQGSGETLRQTDGPRRSKPGHSSTRNKCKRVT